MIKITELKQLHKDLNKQLQIQQEKLIMMKSYKMKKKRCIYKQITLRSNRKVRN